MKKIFITLIILYLMPFLKAQDTISLKNGQLIAAKIIKVEETQMSYYFFNLQNGPLFIKNLSSINWVKYGNGYIDSFFQFILDTNKLKVLANNKSDNIKLDFTINQLDSIAEKDVYENYTRTSGGAVFFTTLLTTPIIGGITSLIVGNTPPSRGNLNLPNKTIIQNEQYVNLYTKKAFKIKKQQVTKNFFTAAVINIFIGFLIFSGSAK